MLDTKCFASVGNLNKSYRKTDKMGDGDISRI